MKRVQAVVHVILLSTTGAIAERRKAPFSGDGQGEGSAPKRAARCWTCLDQATFKFVADSLPLFRSASRSYVTFMPSASPFIPDRSTALMWTNTSCLSSDRCETGLLGP
jgi:hypothetical protein